MTIKEIQKLVENWQRNGITRVPMYKVNYRYFGMNSAAFRWFLDENEARAFMYKVHSQDGGADMERHSYGPTRVAHILSDDSESRDFRL